jgi:beta-barrel assembly-enhancing protease
LHNRADMKHFRHLTVSVIVMFTLACGSTGTGVNKGDFNLISLEEEWQLGNQLATDIAKQMKIVNDPAANAYVNQLGQSIVRNTELANMPWQFHIVEDPAVNAFAIPGGHVYINTGLIAATSNASELAGVMAHEISHDIARHGTEAISRQYGISVLAGVVLGQNPAAYQQILAQIIAGGAMARYSRAAEQEADRLGVRYMAAAGYNPHGMVTMFQELLRREKSEPGKVAQFFSTHPLTTDRIRDVENEIAKLPATGALRTDDPEFQSMKRRLSS